MSPLRRISRPPTSTPLLDPIRVLVVEDSPTVRKLLVEMLESDPELRVVGVAEDGLSAVREAIRLAPDVITMDVNMPGQDGLAATKQIMSEAPTPIIIVSSTASQRSVALSLDATQAGALMVLSKPEGPLGPHYAEQRDELIQMTKAMARVKVVRRWGARLGRSRSTVGGRGPEAATPPVAVRLVAVGCSTGGPAALQRILAGLPAEFPVPITVVQHMALGFLDGLASWLRGSTALRVTVVRDGEPLTAGTVYLAADDRHLDIVADPGGGGRLRARLVDRPPVAGFRPSASYLFAAAARAVGSGAVGVVLTGMGNDGVEGLRELHAVRGRVYAQDEASSVVFGMAREAIRGGVVDEVLSLEEIVARLREVAR
ncbi:MAG: chemotaxis-specific protein-glutamate methyltransferase CheB [Gemmatimonadaceae bacterium]